MLNEGSEASTNYVVVFQHVVLAVSSLTKRGQMLVHINPTTVLTKVTGVNVGR